VRERPGLFGDESVNAGGAKAAAKPDHEGHRARLKHRFAEGGADALPDYELLELLLFNAQPRRDMKPLAKRLIAAFGDFNRVVSAPPARLREVEGCGEAAIHQLKLAEAAAHRLARARALGKPALSSWSAVMDYCKTVMAHREVEQFHLLFLDRKNVLIADEAQTRGTVDAAPVYPREVVKRALELNASALILAHNHPSGDPTPSEADIAMTRRLNEALKTVGVTLHDHLVIGKESDASFRALGLL
jgi:DNA repair protein RadC